MKTRLLLATLVLLTSVACTKNNDAAKPQEQPATPPAAEVAKVETCETKPAPKCPLPGSMKIKAVALQTFFKDVRAKPKMIGQETAWEILQTTDCGVFESFGLQQCDQILKIDGKAVSAKPAETYSALYETMKSGKAAKLEIIRAGNKQTLDLK